MIIGGIELIACENVSEHAPLLIDPNIRWDCGKCRYCEERRVTEWTKERHEELKEHIELELAFRNTKTVNLLTDALAEIERLQADVERLSLSRPCSLCKEEIKRLTRVAEVAGNLRHSDKCDLVFPWPHKVIDPLDCDCHLRDVSSAIKAWREGK